MPHLFQILPPSSFLNLQNTDNVTFFSVYSLLYLLNYVYLAFVSSFLSNKRPEKIPAEWPSVSIHIPVYNERYVVERIIKAVSELDYPMERLQLIIIDDSDDDTTSIIEEAASKHLSDGFEFIHLRRGVRKGFKGGALQEALKHTNAEFIPPRDFLRKTTAQKGSRRWEFSKNH